MLHPLLEPLGLQYTRLLCLTPSSRDWPSSCPVNQWCHPTISSSVSLFSFCLQSFPTSGPFPMHQLFASGSQNIESLASASVLPKHVQGLFPLRLTNLISMLSKALSRLFQHHSLKTSILQCPAFFIVQLSHLHMTTEKTMAWTIRTFVSKVMSLLFNTPSRLVTAFLPRNNQLLISLLQSSSTVILEPKKRDLSLLPPFPLLFAMQ